MEQSVSAVGLAKMEQSGSQDSKDREDWQLRLQILSKAAVRIAKIEQSGSQHCKDEDRIAKTEPSGSQMQLSDTEKIESIRREMKKRERVNWKENPK